MAELNKNEKTALVIFGVTGDLTSRKLVPALYELALAHRLPNQCVVIGFARRNWDTNMMAATLHQGVIDHARTRPIVEEAIQELEARMIYIASSFDNSAGYEQLKSVFEENQITNRLFYLAAPPGNYEMIINRLGEAGINQSPHGWTRIIIEKPYGRDLESALALDAAVHRVFSEDQVYRIDHYLGKETVQNILVFRFANGIFEPLWNQRSVDHVQITVAETVGVGSRAGYYEKSGVIRDMFQNHMLQLLSLTAMEAPVAFTADSVRDEKVKILRSLRPMQGKEGISNTVRAQYVAGTVDGKRVAGYKDEPGVAPNSTTETYLAARLFVDNWRWAGVPFYLRSGKRLPLRMSEICIHFKQVPLPLFGWRNLAGDAPNILTINIQPDEGITLTFGAKAPGPINQIEPVKMSFDYLEAFGDQPPDAYERLLLDCLIGDATLFTRTDEVQAAWSFTNEIINAWNEFPVTHLPVYEAGTWGPPASDELFGKKTARTWDNEI